ncbi:MAG: tRNA-binding protein [Rhodospirillaceae bacterium]|nr:tRNA-binding protein [Alphaproteobacteria bacterium]MBR73066.1 tRNA-binding protein [Rhodospirillaceae bacterium]|tara:strand:- start:1915 stop:2250 length:336 start_codon:yes stop_codon:yes gene_type:complete
MKVSFEDFLKFDIRVGTITDAVTYSEARKPAIKLWIDFGDKIGIKKSSAQITEYYKPETLMGYQVIALINLPPRQIGKFLSEVLVLGIVYEGMGVKLVKPDGEVPNGAKLL